MIWEIKGKIIFSSVTLDSLTDEPPHKKYRSLSRKAQHSDDSDGKHNFHRDDPQIGVCLQYLRYFTGQYLVSETMSS